MSSSEQVCGVFSVCELCLSFHTAFVLVGAFGILMVVFLVPWGIFVLPPQLGREQSVSTHLLHIDLNIGQFVLQ
jgi:hypothetical protein